jgi:hypothetical protein
MDESSLERFVFFGHLEKQPFMLGEVPSVILDKLGQGLKPGMGTADEPILRIIYQAKPPDVLRLEKADEFAGT